MVSRFGEIIDCLSGKESMTMNKTKPENECTVVHDTDKKNELAVPNMIKDNIRFKKLLPILFVVGLIINLTVISLIVSKEVKKDQPPPYALSVGPSLMSSSSPMNDDDNSMGPAGTSRTESNDETKDPPKEEDIFPPDDRTDGKKNISVIYYSLLSVGILLMVPHVIPLVTSRRNITKNKNSMTGREIIENRTSEMEDGCIVEDCNSLG
mmetsp:Transcript_31198/g.61752  ORF Transcript_31198/g.61752 Transcript_31198/m.61752 type:complete len:209 (+) Transcript_31198:225-851(+)